MLSCLSAAFSLVVSAVANDVALVRVDSSKASQPLWLETHAQGQTASDIVGGLKGSDTSFLKLSGGKPVRRVFSVQWDGAGDAEIVVIRELVRKQNHPLELRVYRMPSSTGGSTVLLASTKPGDLGFAEGSGRVLAVGPVDVEPDGMEEIAILREWGGGQRFLEIRRLPKGKKKPLGPSVASDPSFGSSADGDVVAIVGLDADGDFRDELMVLRRPTVGPDRIEGYEIPTVPGGDAGSAFASCLDVTPEDGGQNLGLSTLRLGESKADRILLQRRSPLGEDRIEAFVAPTIIGAALGDPLARDTTLALPGFSVSVFAAFGVEDKVTPPPWQVFTGPWELRLRVRYGSSETVEEWVGPFDGFTGSATSNQQLTIVFPDQQTLAVQLESFDEGAATDLGSDPWYQTLGFLSPIVTGVVRVDDNLVVTYTDGVLHYNPNGRPFIAGIAPASWMLPYIGEVQQAPDYQSATATVFEYRFVKK